jgi:hypothetical protein
VKVLVSGILELNVKKQVLQANKKKEEKKSY